MNKIVLDSDGLIKLAKSGVLEKVLDAFECFVTKDVFKEVVEEGKRLAFDDAFIIDRHVSAKKLGARKHRKHKTASELLRKGKNLGAGEASSLHLFYNLGASAIVSDDQTFLSLLEKCDVPFVIPADMIHKAYESGRIDKNEALGALDNIKPFVRDDVFKKIKNKINGGKK